MICQTSQIRRNGRKIKTVKFPFFVKYIFGSQKLYFEISVVLHSRSENKNQIGNKSKYILLIRQNLNIDIEISKAGLYK